MAGTRLAFKRAAFKALLTSDEVRDDLERRGEAVKQVCTAESSWGGYFTATSVAGDRYTSRVWSISSNLRDQHNRHQRMVRNLDAGS